MIEFKRYGKTVRISNRHWESLRRRFNPDNAKKSSLGDGDFRICRDCLLCKEHTGCKKCGFNVFWDGREETSGCVIFLLRLFKNKVAFYAEDRTEIWWKKADDNKARRQLKRIQKLMDEIEAQQR